MNQGRPSSSGSGYDSPSSDPTASLFPSRRSSAGSLFPSRRTSVIHKTSVEAEETIPKVNPGSDFDSDSSDVEIVPFSYYCPAKIHTGRVDLETKYYYEKLERSAIGFVESGNLNRALPLFVSIIFDGPFESSADFYLEALSCASNLKKSEEEIAISRRFVSAHPTTIDAHFSFARSLMNIRMFEEGAEACTSALQRFPGSELFISLRGKCYYELGLYKHAVADFHQSIELSRKADGLSTVVGNNSLKSWKRTSLL